MPKQNHSKLSGKKNHAPYSFVYPNRQARETATGFLPEDKYKLALQTDDNTLSLLTSISPTIWKSIGHETSINLFASVPSIDEGSVINITVNAGTTLLKGVMLPYIITGVTSADISNAPLSGSITMNELGVVEIPYTILKDRLTEGTETLVFTLLPGTGNSKSVSVSINDISIAPIYNVSFNLSSVNEGSPIVMTLTTVNLEEGYVVPYTITGISSADIGEPLTGNFTVPANGIITKTFNIVADAIAEGNETMTLTLDGVSPSKVISTSITDTSLSPTGEIIYTTPGTYNWIVPANCYSVSAVAIGGGSSGQYGGAGGGLAYKNNVAVSPGSIITCVVGAGGSGTATYPGNAGGNSYVQFPSTDRMTATAGQGSYLPGTKMGYYTGGGTGGIQPGYTLGAGGGAGGYEGNGGSAGQPGIHPTGYAGASGGGGGGAHPINNIQGGGGGGASLYGGKGGVGGSSSGFSGGDGGVLNPIATPGGNASGASGGDYGGGGACGYPGGKGAVRIIYPGATRQFPSTDVA